MTIGKLKEYMLEKYKEQVRAYKKADEKNAVNRVVYLSRVELLEDIFKDIFDWQVEVKKLRKNGTEILDTSQKLIYSWNAKED